MTMKEVKAVNSKSIEGSLAFIGYVFFYIRR